MQCLPHAVSFPCEMMYDWDECLADPAFYNGVLHPPLFLCEGNGLPICREVRCKSGLFMDVDEVMALYAETWERQAADAAAARAAARDTKPITRCADVSPRRRLSPHLRKSAQRTPTSVLGALYEDASPAREIVSDSDDEGESHDWRVMGFVARRKQALSFTVKRSPSRLKLMRKSIATNAVL